MALRSLGFLLHISVAPSGRVGRAFTPAPLWVIALRLPAEVSNETAQSNNLAPYFLENRPCCAPLWPKETNHDQTPDQYYHSRPHRRTG